MQLKWFTIQLSTLFLVLGLGSMPDPAAARTQDLGHDPVTAIIQDSLPGGTIYTPNPSNQIEDFLGDVQDFVRNDLLSPVNRLIQSALGALQIPDLSNLWRQIMTGSARHDPGAILSEVLENKNPDLISYGIRQDLGKYAVRVTANQVGEQATLSQAAQTQILEIQHVTHQATQENVRLGQESQNLDVTQHILQNLSQQTALNSQVSERVLQEAQQARIDRAIANTLSAQTANELSSITTADRRRTISAGNAASQQAGLLMMPGGMTLGFDP